MFAWFKKRHRSKWKSYGLLLWGAILSILGAIGTVTFLREIQRGEHIPPAQLIVQLILPHMALLTGLGLMLAGCIILRKDAIMRERHLNDE